MRIPALALCLLCVAGCAARVPGPSPSAAPSARARPATVRRAVPSVAPAATPLPATPALRATASPVASPSPVPVALLPPSAAPRILRVDLSSTTVSGGDTVRGIVVTSSNVASVEARIASYSIGLSKVGVGRFALRYVVPSLPFFVHATYDMQVIARNTAGERAERTIPITVR